MKPYPTYQHIEGEPMTERDKQEIGSKYWNKGKWDNFVVPFLKGDLTEQTFIDVGCNLGLFLRLAREKRFEKVIGLESDMQTYNKAIMLRDNKNYDYDIMNLKAEECIDFIPLADITLLANSHYYIGIDHWQKYVDKLQYKTCYCIIITAEKKPNSKQAPSDIDGIKHSFKNWKEIGMIDMPKDNTPHSRHLTSICFKSPSMERVPINSLDNGNAQQKDFLKQLDKGIDLFNTDYYRRLKDYRKKTTSKQKVWDDDELTKYMYDRVKLYRDIRNYDMTSAIEVRAKDNRIIDGNHRHNIIRHLGKTSIIVKKV